MNKLIREYNEANKLVKKAEMERDEAYKNIVHIAYKVIRTYKDIFKEYSEKKLYPSYRKSIKFDKDLSYNCVLCSIMDIDEEYITFYADEYWKYGGHAEGTVKFPIKFIENPPAEEEIRAEFDMSLKEKAEKEKTEKLIQLEKLQKELGLSSKNIGKK